MVRKLSKTDRNSSIGMTIKRKSSSSGASREERKWPGSSSWKKLKKNITMRKNVKRDEKDSSDIIKDNFLKQRRRIIETCKPTSQVILPEPVRDSDRKHPIGTINYPDTKRKTFKRPRSKSVGIENSKCYSEVKKLFSPGSEVPPMKMGTKEGIQCVKKGSKHSSLKTQSQRHYSTNSTESSSSSSTSTYSNESLPKIKAIYLFEKPAYTKDEEIEKNEVSSDLEVPTNGNRSKDDIPINCISCHYSSGKVRNRERSNFSHHSKERDCTCGPSLYKGISKIKSHAQEKNILKKRISKRQTHKSKYYIPIEQECCAKSVYVEHLECSKNKKSKLDSNMKVDNSLLLRLKQSQTSKCKILGSESVACESDIKKEKKLGRRNSFPGGNLLVCMADSKKSQKECSKSSDRLDCQEKLKRKNEKSKRKISSETSVSDFLFKGISKRKSAHDQENHILEKKISKDQTHKSKYFIPIKQERCTKSVYVEHLERRKRKKPKLDSNMEVDNRSQERLKENQILKRKILSSESSEVEKTSKVECRNNFVSENLLQLVCRDGTKKSQKECSRRCDQLEKLIEKYQKSKQKVPMNSEESASDFLYKGISKRNSHAQEKLILKKRKSKSQTHTSQHYIPIKQERCSESVCVEHSESCRRKKPKLDSNMKADNRSQLRLEQSQRSKRKILISESSASESDQRTDINVYRDDIKKLQKECSKSCKKLDGQEKLTKKGQKAERKVLISSEISASESVRKTDINKLSGYGDDTKRSQKKCLKSCDQSSDCQEQLTQKNAYIKLKRLEFIEALQNIAEQVETKKGLDSSPSMVNYLPSVKSTDLGTDDNMMKRRDRRTPDKLEEPKKSVKRTKRSLSCGETKKGLDSSPSMVDHLPSIKSTDLELDNNRAEMIKRDRRTSVFIKPSKLEEPKKAVERTKRSLSCGETKKGLDSSPSIKSTDLEIDNNRSEMVKRNSPHELEKAKKAVERTACGETKKGLDNSLAVVDHLPSIKSTDLDIDNNRSEMMKRGCPDELEEPKKAVKCTKRSLSCGACGSDFPWKDRLRVSSNERNTIRKAVECTERSPSCEDAIKSTDLEIDNNNKPEIDPKYPDELEEAKKPVKSTKRSVSCGQTKKSLDSSSSMADHLPSTKSTDLVTDNNRAEMIKQRGRRASLFIKPDELEEPKKPLKRIKRSLSCGTCGPVEQKFPWKGRLRSSSGVRNTANYKERDEDDFSDSPVTDDKKGQALKKIFGVTAEPDPESEPRLHLSVEFDQDGRFFAEVVRNERQKAVAQRDPRLINSRTEMSAKPVESEDSVKNMTKRPVGRPSLKSTHTVTESSSTTTHHGTNMPNKPVESEDSVENIEKSAVGRMPAKPVELEDSVKNMTKRPVGRPPAEKQEAVAQRDPRSINSRIEVPDIPVESEDSVKNIEESAVGRMPVKLVENEDAVKNIEKTPVGRPSLKSRHTVDESSTKTTHSGTNVADKPVESEDSVKNVEKRAVGRMPAKSVESEDSIKNMTKRPVERDPRVKNSRTEMTDKPVEKKDAVETIEKRPVGRAPLESRFIVPKNSTTTMPTPEFSLDIKSSCTRKEYKSPEISPEKLMYALFNEFHSNEDLLHTLSTPPPEPLFNPIETILTERTGSPLYFSGFSSNLESYTPFNGVNAYRLIVQDKVAASPKRGIGQSHDRRVGCSSTETSSSQYEDSMSSEILAYLNLQPCKKGNPSTVSSRENCDTEDFNEGERSSELQNIMEHFKKRLIHQCEDDTTAVDTNGKEAGPGEKKEIKIARKKQNCRSKFRHKDLEIYKLGTNTVSTSLCKSKEPYNVCKEKKLQEASETSSETEKLNRPAIKGRHILPAVVNPIPERRKVRFMSTKNLEDGNNNTDLCKSLEASCNPPENSSQPSDQPADDSAEKPEDSVENSSNTALTIAVEENETAAEKLIEDVSPPVEQENPINLCVKKSTPENEAAKERPKTVNVPVTNTYPPNVQRNIPKKPSQKIVAMTTYPDTSVPASFPTNQMHGRQNQDTQGEAKLQEDILRSVIAMVRDRFNHPIDGQSLFTLNNWYKPLKQYLNQEQPRSSFNMLASVLRETEDFVMANLFGKNVFPISRLFAQEILLADLNTCKDLLNNLLTIQDRTRDWCKRFYDTLKSCIQASNSSRSGLPEISDSNVANSLIAKPSQYMANFKATMPVSQEHTIRMPQQAKQRSTGAQPNYCNVTSCNVSGQRRRNIPPCYLQSNAAAPPQFDQTVYVPSNYEMPNTRNYSNGFPQEMGMNMMNHPLLHGNHSESHALKAQHQMHMAMMEQASRFSQPVNQRIQMPMMCNASLPVNRNNDVVQVHCAAANSVPVSQQARQNMCVHLIDIPPPVQEMQVPANFKPVQSKRRRNSVHQNNNLSVISHSEQLKPASYQVAENRRMYAKQICVPVSSTSQQSMSALTSVHQTNPSSYVPMNTGLEQLRINEMPITRDPRCVQGMRTSKPGSMVAQRMVQGTSGSSVKSKYEVQCARGSENTWQAKSDVPGPVIHLPEPSQDVRVSVESEQINPASLVPVLHIPEVSQDVRVPVNSWTDVDVPNQMSSNMRVSAVHQQQRLAVNSGTQQLGLHVPPQATYRLPGPVTNRIPANAQIQHHDNAGGVRRNITVPEMDSTATSLTFVGRSNAGPSNKPCTATSATITEPTNARASASQGTGVDVEKVSEVTSNEPARPPNTSITSENNSIGSIKPSNVHTTTSTTAIVNVTKTTVPSRTSINDPRIKASRKACDVNDTSSQTESDSTSEFEDSRASHGSSTVSAPIITQDIEEVIQTNVIVDPVRSIERSNLENALPHMITTTHVSTQSNKDLRLTALKQNHSIRQMAQTENSSRSKKVTETNNAAEIKNKQNANEPNDLNSSESELRLIKDVLRHQFKDTYPEIERRVLLAKEEQEKMKNCGTEAGREETVSVESDPTSSISPKRQTEDELEASPKRIRSESFDKGNAKNDPDLSRSYTKTLKIEDISSEDDTRTTPETAKDQKPYRQFRSTEPSENSLSILSQAFGHAGKAVSYPKTRQQLLMPSLLPPHLNCGQPLPAVPFSLPMTPESPLPQVWQTWMDEERLRGNSFLFVPSSGRRQSIETISSAGSDYSPRLNNEDVEIKIDSKWYRVKKHIYDRIPKGKLYYIQQKNIFIRYFDDNQIEQFYRSIGVKNANGSASNHRHVESNAEAFLKPSDQSQVNQVIEIGKQVAFSTVDEFREPEMYVEEIENVRRCVPKDFFAFYQFVTGYQIAHHHYPISFQMFLVLHNTNGLRQLFHEYVKRLMQGHSTVDLL